MTDQETTAVATGTVDSVFPTMKAARVWLSTRSIAGTIEHSNSRGGYVITTAPAGDFTRTTEESQEMPDTTAATAAAKKKAKRTAKALKVVAVPATVLEGLKIAPAEQPEPVEAPAAEPAQVEAPAWEPPATEAPADAPAAQDAAPAISPEPEPPAAAAPTEPAAPAEPPSAASDATEQEPDPCAGSEDDPARELLAGVTIEQSLICIDGLPGKSYAIVWATEMARKLKQSITVRTLAGEAIATIDAIYLANAKAKAAAQKKATRTAATSKAPATPKAAPDGKRAEVVALAMRPQGASVKELFALTQWHKCPWRWTMTNPKGTGLADKYGYGFRAEKDGNGEVRYYLTPATPPATPPAE